jgi:hypothetical protein
VYLDLSAPSHTDRVYKGPGKRNWQRLEELVEMIPYYPRGSFHPASGCIEISFSRGTPRFFWLFGKCISSVAAQPDIDLVTINQGNTYQRLSLGHVTRRQWYSR